MNSVHQHRRQVLAEECRKYSHLVNKPNWEKWRSMHFYDDQMQYVYCRIGKTANTNWRRTLLMLSGNYTRYGRPELIPRRLVHSRPYMDKHIKRLEKLQLGERDRRLRKYYKFLFVREPLERLLSAYRDKLVVNNGYGNVDVAIVRKYRPNDYNPAVKRYKTTFAEFIRYILDQHAAGRVLDRHWLPQSKLCSVCDPPFDFVGHLETLHTDARFVVATLKSRIHNKDQRRRIENVAFPAERSDSKTKDLMKQMYATIPASDIRALYSLYAVDYALFGFKHPDVTGFH